MTEMHNCKNVKKNLVEMALPGWIPNPDELADCPHCREELASLRLTSQIADAAMQLAQPGESFWAGYHSRLRQRLTDNSTTPQRRWGPVTWFREFATLSIPIPAPLALAAFALIAFSVFFALQSRTKSSAAPVPPTLVDRVVEVPVIQERQITRVVYRDRRSLPPQSGSSYATQLTMARKRDVQAIPVIESLDGFKPVNEARLTLISGGRDEK